MTRKESAPGVRPRQLNKSGIFQEKAHDSYKSRGKLPEPTQCPECGAVFRAGRWQWLAKPPKAHSQICPACHRIADGFPAGYLTLEGDFLKQHRDQIMQLARNVERKEKSGHPLQRIMGIEDRAGAMLVTTTDVHLARGIGEALRHAFKGTLDLHYSDAENLVRVRWRR